MADTPANAMIRKLVGFDTTSRNSNLHLIEFIKSHLDEQGVGARLTFDEDRTKANLFATLLHKLIDRFSAKAE